MNDVVAFSQITIRRILDEKINIYDTRGVVFGANILRGYGIYLAVSKNGDGEFWKLLVKKGMTAAWCYIKFG